VKLGVRPHGPGKLVGGGVMVFGVLLVIALGLELDRRGLEGAAGSGRQHEQGQRIGQHGLGLLDRRLVLLGFGSVLEPHDVRTRRHQLHRDAAVLDGDVEHGMAVLVRTELAPFLGQGRPRRRRGQGHHHHAFHRVHLFG
jgi:hypothetical protein